MQELQVAVPPGAKGGDTIALETSSGTMQVVVPHGLSAGHMFVVQAPTVGGGGLQATVPVGANGGDTIVLQTPSGNMQVVVPPGLTAGATFMVQVAPAAPVVAPVVPVAPVPLIDVPATVRKGDAVYSRDAEAYCASIPRHEARASNYSGCRKVTCVKGGDCSSCSSCCLCFAYSCACSDDCICFPFFCGICPIPFINPFPCICSCERVSNQWVTRGKHGEKTGAWVIVDAERKTIASYGVKCCTNELSDQPQCYCEQI